MKGLPPPASNPASDAAETARTGDWSCDGGPETLRKWAHEPPVARRRLLAGMSALGAMVFTGCGSGSDSASEYTPSQLGSNLRDISTVPTLVMESNPSGVVKGPFTLRFQFSSDVANFDTASFSVSGGGSVVVGSFTRFSLSEYSVRIAPPTNAVGTILVAVAPFDIRDETGAIGRRTLYSFSQPYDTVV